MLVGILAEKPSQARNFAKALGGMKGKFEGTDYVICAARGHVVELVDPAKNVDKDKADRYKSWDLDYLPWNWEDFHWKYQKRGDTAGVIKDIKNTLSVCDEVVIGTDDDPTGEGELLAWEALDAAGVKAKKWSRMYFVDEAPKSVQKAFRERKSIRSKDSDKDYLKALYRSRWDYLSMQFTRIATASGDGHSVLRQGRLKSAMIVLVGDQLKKVSEYKKIPSYRAQFKDENGVEYIDKNQKEYPHREDVSMGGFHVSDVVHDKTERKSAAPPKLMDLAALSARLAPKGLNAKYILSTYQKMYEAQIASYPRTEDKFVSHEQFDELLPLASKIAKVVGVNPKLLTHTQPRKTHVKDGGAHGANRPGPNVPKSLEDLDAQFGNGAGLIYETVAKNYLAMLCEDYEYDREVGYVRDFPTFKGSANVPAKLGWKAVFDDEEKDENENAKGLGKKAEPYVHEGFPPKPQNPTMRWLMKQLENRNVGTGATRTSIYADVVNQKVKFPLMKDTRGRISFTQYGEMSYAILPGTHIGDLAMTEKLMGEMDGIAKGDFNPETGFEEMAKYVRDDIATMKANGAKLRDEKGIAISKRIKGSWKGKEVFINGSFSGHEFTQRELQQLFDDQDLLLKNLVSAKSGNEFGALVHLKSVKKGSRTFTNIDVVEFRNADGSKQDARGAKGSAWKKPPQVWFGHKFTKKELETLQKGGKVTIKNPKRKDGSVFNSSATVVWSEKGGVKFA